MTTTAEIGMKITAAQREFRRSTPTRASEDAQDTRLHRVNPERLAAGG